MTSEGKPCEVCPDSKRDICWKSTSMGCPTWEAWITMVNRIKRVEALPQKWRSTEKAHDGVRCHAWKVCADELEDELSGIQGKALDGEPSKPGCDMVDTDLCKHYQKRLFGLQCHYKSSHGVKCLKEKSR